MPSDDVCNEYLTLKDLEFMEYPEENMTKFLVYRIAGITPGMLKCLTAIVEHVQCRLNRRSRTKKKQFLRLNRS
ncbi:unnamed protein product [Kuraishia capsulata CBS 1993]|uniref:Uncharacterized protein n=1 Tax=Kuraishia capsulata CBS 1993 TaxID=1382522 RepID=W6MPV9_9ASCO|nr:uncharacterized protein KUCA_T00004744001 [Kuraishia capsulata CBS 1993]CDK28759.1 unnamed protein product [Kuraishia capsulata CBS 1993]